MGSAESAMQNEIFNLKMNAKQLSRQSIKCKKASADEKLKVKRAIEQGNREVARIHAENAIRQHNQYINFLRLSSRMDAIGQRLQSAQTVKQLNKSLTGVTKIMTSAVQSMNLEKIAATMDQFEKSLEDLDIHSNVMESAIQQSQGNVMPEDQVDELMQQVAEEHGLKLMEDFDQAVVPKGKKPVVVESDDDLEKRLEALKNQSGPA